MGSIEFIFAVCFWACAAGVFYAYAVYPVVLVVLAKFFGSHAAPARLGDGELPPVSLLIAAHDEEAVIEQRVKNALAMDYPAGKLEVIIASDGSTDRTAEIVRRYADRGVRLLDFGVRRGKATVLNAAMPEVRGKLVLLSDANTDAEPDAARQLARWFADPRVGAVCGRLVIRDPANGNNVDGVYWRYETFLKEQESQLGALLGSNGAIYAIRRELFQPIPEQTIIDDFVIPLLARLRSGCRIVYDPQAVAHEESSPDIAGEFRRRVRIGAGGWQALGMLWPLLDVRQGWVAFTFLSHKVLRWACPFLMLGMLLSNLPLIGVPMYRAILFAQLGLYAAALVAPRVPTAVPLSRFLRVGGMFVSMNAALLVGFFRWWKRSQGGTWARTRRSIELSAAPAIAPSPNNVAASAAE